MSEKIEFEAEVTTGSRVETGDVGGYIKQFHCVEIPLSLLWSTDSDRIVKGQLYRVTLEPIKSELKPCPFCEGKGKIEKDDSHWQCTS